MLVMTWLCRQRRRAFHNADIWHLRFYQDKYLKQICRQVNNAEYRLSPPQLLRTEKNKTIALWSATDAMVMKWFSLEIKDKLPLHERCVHTTGHRGGRDSLAEIMKILKQGANFV